MRYCITGGIGAGKTYVCEKLEQRGIRIYNCDTAAKRLMHTSPALRHALTALIGPETYHADGTLNKQAVTQYLLTSEENKQRINAIVHPAVMEDFYSSGMQWMESAILYEARLERYVDKVIAVTAPDEIRIKRIMQRDGIPYEKARQWLDNQIDQEAVANRADFVILNDGTANVDNRLNELIATLGIT